MQQQIPSTSPHELYETVEDGTGVTVVDVRQPHEFQRRTIEHPNARAFQ